MLLKEDLSGRLPELCDLDLECRSLDGVLERLEVDSALVGHRVEDVVVLDRALMNTKYKVDPMMEVFGDVFRFEGLPVLAEEFSWSLRPPWQLNIIYSFTV